MTSPLRQGSRSRERGVALIVVMLFSVVFLVMIGTLLDILAMEAHSAKSSVESDAALTAAYAGVDAQIYEIENYFVLGVGTGQPPDVGQQTYKNESGGTTNAAYDAVIANSYDDNGQGQRYYAIQSDGIISDSTSGETLLQRRVTALAQEVLLGQYPLGTNSEQSNTGGIVYYTSGQQYNGLVYSGGRMHIVYQPGDPPIFENGFETDTQPVWYDMATGNTKAPVPGTAAWNAVFGPGATYNTDTHIDLPGLDQNLIVFSEAFAGDESLNTLSAFQQATNGLKPGVYVDGATPPGGNNVPLNTGIFVQGDVTLTAAATDTSETFTFQPLNGDGFPPTTVTIDFNANTTTVQENGTTTVYNGVASGSQSQSSLASGALFIDGSVDITDGSTIRGQYNIALPDPPTSGQQMTVDGSVTYQFQINKQDTPTDELALWANDIALNTTSSNPTVDAMLLTGYVNECESGKCADGSFYNSDCNSHGCSGPSGTINLFGSLLENIRGKMGELDSNGHLIGGFVRNATYDARLGANPPPDTPTTNQYRIVAIQDDGTP